MRSAVVASFICPCPTHAHRYIHTRGILYCDLKPSNLMVDGSGVVKLSDFGLAQLADQLDYGKV